MPGKNRLSDESRIKKLRTFYSPELIFIDEVFFLDDSVPTDHSKYHSNDSDYQKDVNNVSHSKASKAEITDQPQND